MAVNPNFFPNGYQDPMHPEEEVVTNWVRHDTKLNYNFANLMLSGENLNNINIYRQIQTLTFKRCLILEHLRHA